MDFMMVVNNHMSTAGRPAATTGRMPAAATRCATGRAPSTAVNEVVSDDHVFERTRTGPSVLVARAAERLMGAAPRFLRG
mmetsp:Transcript_88360/g.108175  ORF Transcript_88360/g.108175 Transcript_88360/m.108175 type:complete len:80 (+) Transcript_88360:121-360(+)